MNNLGLAFYTVSGCVSKPEEYEGLYRKIRAMGYKFIEIGLSFPVPLPEYVKLLKDTDLKIMDVHIPLDVIKKDFANSVKAMKALECKYVTIPHPGSFPLNNEDDWKKLAKEATDAGKKLSEEGLILQYHNHHLEFQKYGSRTGIDVLYSESDPKYLKAQIDTHWVCRGGGSPAAWILKMKGRIEQIHFKDTGLMDKSKPIFAVAGEGNLDWPGILAACRECEIKNYVIEVDPNPYTPDPIKTAEIGYKNLLKMGLGD